MLSNPDLILAAKLVKVLDAGYATIEAVAVESGYGVDVVEGLANGLPIKTTLSMRFRIASVLAPHFKEHPELYEEIGKLVPTARNLSGPPRLAKQTEPMPGERGVFEIEADHDYWRKFLIRASTGERKRIILIPAHECTDDDIEKLWQWLDRRDPILKVI